MKEKYKTDNFISVGNKEARPDANVVFPVTAFTHKRNLIFVSESRISEIQSFLLELLKSRQLLQCQQQNSQG